MSIQHNLKAHNALDAQRTTLAQKLKGMIWHPTSIRRAFGAQDTSTGLRSTLQPDVVSSNAAAKGAAIIRAKARDWRIGACQVKHEVTVANTDNGYTMRYSILLPYSNGQEKGETSVPVSVRVAEGRLYIDNEQKTAEMARKASRGEFSAPEASGMKRTAQFEDAPRASKGLEALKAKKDKIVKQLDDISAAVDKAMESSRKRTLKDQGHTEETIKSLETGKKETLEQYARELQEELEKAKARVLQTSDGNLVTLEVKTKRNPKYESIMTFLTNFFSRADKFIVALIARYSWMSKTISAFETGDPKEMTKKLKQTDKNLADLDKFKEDRGVADGHKRWQSDKFPPAVNAPASKDGGPVEERFGRLIQAEEEFTETSSGDIGEDFRDARDAVKAFNDMTEADEETSRSLADDQQLDAELPSPVTEVGERAASRSLLTLPFDSGRTAAQEPSPSFTFNSAEEVPMTAFKRVAKKKEDSVAPSKREALLADGWSEAEVDAHLASSK